jgi:hypothetical protein
MKKDRYVIVDSRVTVGNSVVFWCYDRSGYTCDLRMAGIYTVEEAKQICRGRSTDRMFKYSSVLKIVQHHVDCQDLYRRPRPKIPHTYSRLEAVNEV